MTVETIDRRTFLNRGVWGALALGLSLPLGRAQLGCAQSGSTAEGAVQILRAPIVLRAGETDVLVVRAEGSREELMFPAIASVVREVDITGGRVVVVPQEVLG